MKLFLDCHQMHDMVPRIDFLRKKVLDTIGLSKLATSPLLRFGGVSILLVF